MKAITLPFIVKSAILACGADLKGAFALAKGDKAFLFDGFGDLAQLDNFERYEKAAKASIAKTGIRPKIVACDLHPGYFSTRLAETYTLYAKRYPLLKIQHHEAHIASAITEHSIKGDVIGVAFDGTGFGVDGNIWGGEFFVGNVRKLKRIAHLEYTPMPGGEAAIHEPWRMAASHLYRCLGNGFLRLKIDFVKGLDKKKWPVIRRMVDKGLNSPLTSSMGRLFDAAGSIVLSRQNADFEAELPIILERVASSHCDDAYTFDIRPDKGILVIQASRLIKGIAKDLAGKADISVISAKFHNTVADMVLKVALTMKKKSGIGKVVLSGGVFQNSYLSGRAVILLEEAGFKVYTHGRIAANDSGIPIGQLAIANENFSRKKLFREKFKGALCA